MTKNRDFLLAIILTIAIILISTTTSYSAYQSYRIQEGDSLFFIAKKFNTTISTLSRLNNIDNPNTVYTGQTIKLPFSKPKQTAPKKSSNFYSSNSNRTSSNEKEYGKFVSSNQSQYFNSSWNTNNDLIVAKKINKSVLKKVYRKAERTTSVALTFDDGPDPIYTPKVLDVLKRYNVKATFFIVGNRVVKYPSIVKRIYDEGHTIANHSWGHPDLRKLSKEELREEMLKTEQAIENIIGRKTALMRPPYGAYSSDTLDVLHSMGYKVINWSVDTLDWRAKTAKDVVDRTLPDIHDGAIILFHSAGGKGQSLMPTVNALPTIIETLQAKDIKLVNVDDLLMLSPYKA